MNGLSTGLPFGVAVRFFVAAVVFLGFGQLALAQDAGSPADPEPTTDATAPADAAPATDAAPASSEPAPAEAAAPANDTVPTIPVAADQPGNAPGKIQLDKMEVTGSRLRRTDYETAAPVVTITREDIERTGLTDLNEVLRHMSVAGNNSTIPAIGRGYLALGEVNLDLRNLGGQHTLLLVNGRRWVTGLVSTQPNISDYNTIPTSIIERVEVLKDGASAIYGSDAIAGVVNIITRKDYQGLGVDYHVGGYVQQGDGLNQQASIDWGATKPGQSLFVNLSWTNQDRAETQNREFTKSPIPTAGTTRWSNNTERGRYLFIGNNANASFYACPNLQAGIADSTLATPGVSPVIQATKPIPAGLALCDLARKPDATGTAGPGNTTLDDYRYKTGEDVYNRFKTDSLEQPNQRTALFVQLTQDLLEHAAFSFEGLYNKRKTNTLSSNIAFIGGNGAGAGFGRAGASADNPTNPFGQDVGISAQDLPTQGYGFWSQRLVSEAGQLHFMQDVDTLRLGGTLRGDFQLVDTVFNWSGGYIWSKNKITETVPLENFDTVQRLMGNVVDPNTGAVTYDASVCNGPCLDVFHGQENLDYNLINQGFSNTHQNNEGGQDIAFADLSFELPNFGEILAGPIALALGGEYRKDRYKSEIDPLIKAGNIVLINQQQDSGGNTYTREAYLEMGIPLVKDLPFLHSADLDLAGRFTAAPGFGSITTGKAGLRWQPLDDVLVRGSYSTGFRAPSIAELNLPASQSADPLTDPCADPTKDSTTQANCNADGGGSATGQNTTPYALWAGNPKLDPESSVNITYGVIYSPHFVPDLNLGVDFYKITLEKFITIGGGLGQYFLDNCYKYTTRNYCEYVSGTGHRDQTGDLIYVNVPFFNLGKIQTSGVDFNADYVLPLPATLGRFKFEVDASYLTEFNQYTPKPGAPDVVSGLVGRDDGQFSGYPRWKGGTELTWKGELWNASWSTHLAYHMVEPCQDSYGAIDPTVAYSALGLCSDPRAPVADDPPTPHVDESQPGQWTKNLKTIVYHDLTLGREIPEYKANITIGLKNVLDSDPPISYSNTGSLGWFNYDPQAYETPGRVGYLQASFKF